MKIGILTFHWSTNYGAVLQAFALQEYLTGMGHDVKIINYKPSQYDYSWLKTIAKVVNIRSFRQTIYNIRKESLLSCFRKRYLYLTERKRSIRELESEVENYDVLISGSDQVLNPMFTLFGDNGSACPVYWLGVGSENIKKIGYAVSFGCELYPHGASIVAKRWVNDFDEIGTRERTGTNILSQLSYKGTSQVVPDPTLLLGPSLFEKLHIARHTPQSKYICVYMLRYEIMVDGNVRFIDTMHAPLSMEQWLSIIINASGMITNSYHGMLMAIYAHVPFSVILENGEESGMNDRFFTILAQLGLENRVASNGNEALKILKVPIDFKAIDERIESFRYQGISFLQRNLME